MRDLTGFGLGAQPSLDKAQIRETSTGRFIANGEAVLHLGPRGVSKTHLAVALGREAIVADYSVLFTPATTLVAQLAKAHGEGRLEERLSTGTEVLPDVGFQFPTWQGLVSGISRRRDRFDSSLSDGRGVWAPAIA